jgi:hypothetical protein
MPPLLLDDLPTTRQLVRASILAVGLVSAAAGCGDDMRVPTDSSAGDTSVAPTCGPCCHGGTDCDSSVPILDSAVDSGTDAAEDAASDASGDAAPDAADAAPDAS